MFFLCQYLRTYFTHLYNLGVEDDFGSIYDSLFIILVDS